MLVLLSGVSGAGKDTLKNIIVSENENYTKMPALTTRNKRVNEKDGDPYFFLTTEEFEDKIKNNELYEYSKHHDNYYGTSKKILEDTISQGKVIIKDMDVNGTENLKKILKDNVKVITVFLKVEKEELRKRLDNREDKLSKEEIELRLSRFEYEESKIGVYDYVIKNDNLTRTKIILENIIKLEINEP